MITSGYALAPATRAPTYSATKAGLRAFAKALRRQVQPLGINVLEVIPGFVDTPAVAARPGRKIAPEEVAAATLAAMKRGRSQTTAGATRWLPLLLRLSPRLAENMVAKT